MIRRIGGLGLSLSLAGCMATAEPPSAVAPAPPPPGIQVVTATYGGNCKAPPGNVTPHLQQSCGGRMTCSYKVEHTVIGDPVSGCSKDYVAEWRCGADPAVRKATAAPEAGFGSVVELRCE
jgi:hypothetical protein